MGLFVLRTMKSGGGISPMSMFSGGFGSGMMAVIIPSEDLLEVAAQAPEKAEEPPAEEPAEEANEEADSEPSVTLESAP